MALAYLLDPLADRLERLGINRAVAALLIVGVVVARSFVVGAAAWCRSWSTSSTAFIDNLPGYVAQAAGAGLRSKPAVAAKLRRATPDTEQVRPATW